MIEKKCKQCEKTFLCKPSHSSKRKHCSRKCYDDSQVLVLPPFTDRQLEIINGCLLGDGGIRPNGRNCYFQEIHSIKCKEYCDYLADEFGEWFGNLYEYYPTDSKHYPTCQFRSRTHPFWTDMREKWYPQNKKIVPRDLKLTPLTMAHWFCGDGSNYDEISIATCCFAVADVEFLVDKLENDLAVKSYMRIQKRKDKYKDRVYPSIFIRACSISWFLDLISPHITWQCFLYKMKRFNKRRRFECYGA